MIFLTAWRS